MEKCFAWFNKKEHKSEREQKFHNTNFFLDLKFFWLFPLRKKIAFRGFWKVLKINKEKILGISLKVQIWLIVKIV